MNKSEKGQLSYWPDNWRALRSWCSWAMWVGEHLVPFRLGIPSVVLRKHAMFQYHMRVLLPMPVETTATTGIPTVDAGINSVGNAGKCSKCGSRKHSTHECNTDLSKIRCFKCNAYGHIGANSCANGLPTGSFGSYLPGHVSEDGSRGARSRDVVLHRRTDMGMCIALKVRSQVLQVPPVERVLTRVHQEQEWTKFCCALSVDRWIERDVNCWPHFCHMAWF